MRGVEPQRVAGRSRCAFLVVFFLNQFTLAARGGTNVFWSGVRCLASPFQALDASTHNVTLVISVSGIEVCHVARARLPGCAENPTLCQDGCDSLPLLMLDAVRLPCILIRHKERRTV